MRMLWRAQNISKDVWQLSRNPSHDDAHAVWQLYCLATWPFGNLTVGQLGCFWQPCRLATLPFGNLAVWQPCRLATLPFGNFAVWQLCRLDPPGRPKPAKAARAARAARAAYRERGSESK
eukprot:5974758-Pyramimonas_sp.AAC.1